MIYTGVFQDRDGIFTFESHVAPHDRNLAWREIYENRDNKDACLVLLIDGQANVKTFQDIVDLPF